MTVVQLIEFLSCYSSSGLFKHPCPWSMSPLFPLQPIVGWEWPHWHLYAPGWLVEVKLHQDRWVLQCSFDGIHAGIWGFNPFWLFSSLAGLTEWWSLQKGEWICDTSRPDQENIAGLWGCWVEDTDSAMAWVFFESPILCLRLLGQ